jgi:hypothetical protein
MHWWPPLTLACLPAFQDLVDVENKKLDRFHIKDHIQEAAHDIAAGNILRSMQVRSLSLKVLASKCICGSAPGTAESAWWLIQPSRLPTSA